MSEKGHILVTGGAGYIGSLLTSELLRAGYRVTVLDNLLYGGEALLAFLPHPNFQFSKADVTEPGAVRSALRRDWPKPEAFVHLAAIVGFPACQAIGKQAAGLGSSRVYNLGSEDGNLTKDEIVGLVIKRLPETMVTHKDLTFGGDRRDIAVSFESIRRDLGFSATLTVDDGVREVVYALRTGLFRNPQDERYTNARFLVQ
jgi:nucleoside-diphosphate-sugar epimerase